MNRLAVASAVFVAIILLLVPQALGLTPHAGQPHA